MFVPSAEMLSELPTNTMIDVYVGPENTRWHLHKNLLSHYSEFFQKAFNGDSTSYGLPDEDDRSFALFVIWLYHRHIEVPRKEHEVVPILNLALMADKWHISELVKDTLEIVRLYYHNQGTYPWLCRVQYVYANTSPSSTIRQMMIACVARYLILHTYLPSHWERALQKNGLLCVDIIKAIHDWHLSADDIPDPRFTALEHRCAELPA